MAEYKHGAYGQVQAAGTRIANQSTHAIVYVGTAPVHTIAGGAANVDRPVLVQNMAEARKLFGYSDDWAAYTLCEAMYVHFALKGVGPIVLINVLDPLLFKADEGGTVQLTPVNGRVTIVAARSIILDTVKVTGKELGADYAIAYDQNKGAITLMEKEAGSLGADALSITYDLIDPSKADESAVIGSTDNEGDNKGLYAIKNVHQATAYIPSMLLCPGFSTIPAVHRAMIANSVNVNGHWDVYVYADLPIADKDGEFLTLSAAPAWKNENGYNQDHETVFFPMAGGVDGRKYHLSVLAAANLQELSIAQDGIPYRTAGNTAAPIIQNLFMGAENEGRVFDDDIINNKLNKNGIASATFVGGRWAIWGAHAASYDQENADWLNVSETNKMMLFYISNDFQRRRALDIDRPMTANDIMSIIAEEQQMLDALVKIGALTYGTVHNDAGADYKSDVMKGDYVFTFQVTTTPLAKSMTAVVSWTDEGFTTYFQA